MAKKGIIKKEIAQFKKDGSIKPFTVTLSDLVMMQMVGRFDEFLEKLPSEPGGSFSDASAMIEETRENVTTEKLFNGIVRKSVEAQFGEKHVTVRELGQNGLDSYKPNDYDRRILFDVDEKKRKRHVVLRARDFGVGMDLKDIIKNLLIPYNSGKEFDPTKIGEHGIGWYSIVDIADVVKVTSRRRGSSRTSQALIYREGDEWYSTLNPSSSNGFCEQLNLRSEGTEVTAYIPSNATSLELIREHLHKYVGMVENSNGKITCNGVPINNIRGMYTTTVPIPVCIDHSELPLTMGVSKRLLQGRSYGDSRFADRNRNLEKILMTQRGLFIKYEDNQFDGRTFHCKFLNSMMQMGLDFWVEVPEHVTLTKGRNNIIADHNPAVLEAMYVAFENLFTDVLLCDEEILNHHSNQVFSCISQLFDKDYSELVNNFEKKKYSAKRRFMSNTALVGSKAVDIGALVGKGLYVAGRYIARCFLHVGQGICKGIAGSYRYFRDDFSEDYERFKKALKKKLKKYLPMAAKGALRAGAITAAVGGGLGAVGLGLYGLYKILPFDWFVYGLVGATAAAVGTGVVATAYAAYKRRDEIWKGISGALGYVFNFMNKPINLPWEKIGNYVKDKGMRALNYCGLYLNVEQKRERKRERKKKKIARKHLWKWSKTNFIGKIMQKEIIPAEYYFKPEGEAAKPDVLEVGTFEPSRVHKHEDKDLLDLVEGSEEAALPQRRQIYEDRKDVQYQKPKHELDKRIVRISIDQMVDFYIRGKLKYRTEKEKEFGLGTTIKEGDYYVDSKNQLVSQVLDRLDEIKGKIGERYNVNVLEDHLDNVLTIGKEIAFFIYGLTPPGMIHMYYTLFRAERDGRQGAGLPKRRRQRTFFDKSYLFKWWRRRREAKQKEPGMSLTERVKIAASNAAPKLKGAAVTTGQVGWWGIKLPFRMLYGIFYGTCWATYHGVCAAKGVGGKLDPRKYPDYCRSVKRKASEWYTDYKKDRERQKRYDEMFGPKEPLLKRAGKAIRDWFHDVYRNSLINYFLGYSEGSSRPFKDMGLASIRSLAERSKVGQAYPDFVDLFQKIDEVVSAALGVKPYNITCEWGKGNSKSSEGFLSDAKNISIDLGQAKDLVQEMRPSSFYRMYKRTDKEIVKIGYKLLDHLLHLHAHRKTEEFEHRGGYRIEHYDSIHNTKAELRKKVVDHMQENGIDFMEFLKNAMSEKDIGDRYYYVPPMDFASLNNMTMRRLHDEALYYDFRRYLARSGFIKIAESDYGSRFWWEGYCKDRRMPKTDEVPSGVVQSVNVNNGQKITYTR
jgi:hypothetical protein